MTKNNLSLNPENSMIRSITVAVLFIVSIGFSSQIAFADDSNPKPINYTERYKKAEKLVYKEKYTAAIKILKTITKGDSDNADAWNLQGFALRKSNKLEQAEAAYLNALEIDPEHKGALEYQGELFIMLGDIDSANANLKKLEMLCPDGCEERDLLQAALNNT